MDRIPIGLIQLLIFLSHANTVTNPAVLHFSLELAVIYKQNQLRAYRQDLFCHYADSGANSLQPSGNRRLDRMR
jgi:hypothetical protein